tara:strand:- start:281 stop:688 length:408 start_codon:yes stop_codon:yes gene_type:complete
VIRGDRHSGGGEYLVLGALAFFPWRLLPAFLILGLLISPFVDKPEPSVQREVGDMHRILNPSPADVQWYADRSWHTWRVDDGGKGLEITSSRYIGDSQRTFVLDGLRYTWTDPSHVKPNPDGSRRPCVSPELPRK